MIKSYILLGNMMFALAAHAELATPIVSSDTTKLSNNPTIQKFLEKESKVLSEDFPYRMNLFTQGKLDKNNAGLRISETPNQLADKTQGLLFYYELVTNGMRVPHWHSNATEIGTVLEGKMRVTIWDGVGKVKVFTVEKNGTWIIPKAKLHSLENVGTEKMKFLVAYDTPIAADRDFVTAWASLPDDILARSVGLSVKDIENIKKTTINRLSEYDSAAGPEKTDEASPLSNNFAAVKPLYQSELGSITRIDAKVNSEIGAMAIQRTIVKPGVLRIPHWYTSGDVLFFVLKGDGFFTMMDDDGKVYHSKVKRGDLITIPIGNFHGILNIGNGDLEVYEVFNRSDDIQEITLKNGVEHFSAGLISGTTGLSTEVVKKISSQPSDGYMIKF